MRKMVTEINPRQRNYPSYAQVYGGIPTREFIGKNGGVEELVSTKGRLFVVANDEKEAIVRIVGAYSRMQEKWTPRRTDAPYNCDTKTVRKLMRLDELIEKREMSEDEIARIMDEAIRLSGNVSKNGSAKD